MKMTSLVVFGVLLCTALATTLKVKEESLTAFLMETFDIIVPSAETTEVLFKPSRVPAAKEQVLMSGGQLQSPRVELRGRNHLQVTEVGLNDSGTYIVKYSDEPGDVKHIVLAVRDCFVDKNVKPGESFTISLKNISGPVSLEFRPGPEGNATAGSVVHVLERSWTPAGEYAARLTALEQQLTLHAVTPSDEGSYAVLDSEGRLKKKVCLNVKEHQNFVTLPYSGTLKINLILNSTKVKVLYTPNYDFKGRVILDQGVLAVPMDPSLEGRLSLQGSTLILERVRASDTGTFSVMDLQGFPVSNVYLEEVEGYKLPPLVVAVISLLSLLVFLLFVCLVSCLVKVRRRALKARAIEKIAQNAGKDEGDAFRQVVQHAYTRFNEESTTQSQCDSSTMKTEVDIKGLEVSKNLLEMSDSGVEFSAPGLPHDSDTDAPPSYTSPKIQVDSGHLNSTAVPEAKPSVNQTPDSKPSANQIPESKPIINQIPESKPSIDQTPDSKPSINQTLDSKPSVNETPDSKPSINQTPDKTPDAKPSPDQTLDSKPSAEQTPDFNLGVNGATGSDSKPSGGAAPEPAAKAAPEAAPPDAAAPEPAAKSPKPGVSDAPASEANAGAAPAQDGPSGGPASEALLDAAPPGQGSVSPVQDASKEKAAT
ncbi:uncharacterized protein si:dkeyp-77h1.4 [Anguilla anguilla]|uniref:uncharacterized protein si:dkeyp-77h1.4 n=1 Tax=Anguilla anguilla TaxID=7936 RepID=UPI0015AA311C|nr:uncharacterized protein si:dkeyp-77h1.4 [Anguilla anguilla]